MEKLLDGPTVSETVGKKTINIVSNLMKSDSQSLSASANRCKSHKPHIQYIQPYKSTSFRFFQTALSLFQQTHSSGGPFGA